MAEEEYVNRDQRRADMAELRGELKVRPDPIPPCFVCLASGIIPTSTSSKEQ